MTDRPLTCGACGQVVPGSRVNSTRVVRVKRGKDWLWSRYLLEGTRIQPANLAVPVREGYTVEQVADLFAVTDETVRTAIEWYAKRSRRAPDAMFSSQKEHE